MVPGVGVLPSAHAAITFQQRCGGSVFNSIADAHTLCLGYGEFLATPRTTAEFSQVQSFSPFSSIIGGTKPSGSTWSWAYGPFANTVFYIDGIGDTTTPGVPWHSSSVLSGAPIRAISYYGSGGYWASATFPTTTQCAVCQSITTCGEVCSATGTQSYSGTAWSSCTCVCRSGYVGSTCNRQTQLICNSTSITSASAAKSACRDRGGFLATPTSMTIMNELRSLSGTTAILLGGSDELVEGQWVWTDGPHANQQFYQGVSGGNSVNGFPTYWGPGQPDNWFEEDHLTLSPVLWNDINLLSSVLCYACQYTGCSISPCTSPNTLSATGTKFTDCVCGCKNGFGGPFCQCALNGCDLRGGVMVQGPTSCSCVCKPNYNGVNCDERTDTPTPSITPPVTDTTLLTSSATLTLSESVPLSASTSLSTSTTPNTPSISPTALTFTQTLVSTASASIPTTSTRTQTRTQTRSADTQSLSTAVTMSGSRLLTSTNSVASGSHSKTASLHRTTSDSYSYSYSHSHSCHNVSRTHTPVVEVLGASPLPCPGVTMTLSRADSNASVYTPIGSTTIDDTDVREGLLMVSISLVGGSAFAFRSSMPGSIRFGLESAGIQDPRSFPAVVNTADIVCGFSPLDLRRVIECTFPRSPDYTIRVAELLVVKGDGSGVTPACASSPWTLGTIRVRPTKTDMLTQIFQVAAAVVTGVATAVVMLLADGTPIEIQVMIVLLNSACASSVDRESVLLVRYFLSPAIHLGWWWVVVINVCTAIGFAALHTGVVASVYAYRIRRARSEMPLGKGRKRARVPTERKYEISRDVSSTLLYPGLPLAICHVMYIGVACGTFEVLSGTSGADAAMSILGLAFLVSVPVVDAYLLSRVVTVAHVAYDLLGCVPKNGRLAWLYPKGVWGPTADVRRYFGLIGPYRDGYRYGTLVPLGLALLAALAMHGLNGVVACDYLFVAMTVMAVLLGVVFLILRPTRATAQSLLTSLCLICVGLLAVMQIIAIRANSPSVEVAKSVINYTVVFMVIVRSAHNMFVAYIEWNWAREVDAASEAIAAGVTQPRIHQPREVDEGDTIEMSPKENPPTARPGGINVYILSNDVTTHTNTTTTTHSSSESSSRRKSRGFGALLDRHAQLEIDHAVRLQVLSPKIGLDDEFEVTSASTCTQRPGATASRQSISSSICTQDRLIEAEKQYTSKQQEHRQRFDAIVPISGPLPNAAVRIEGDTDECSSPDEAESPSPQQRLCEITCSTTSTRKSNPPHKYFPEFTLFDEDNSGGHEEDCVDITISPGADLGGGDGSGVRKIRNAFLSPTHRGSPGGGSNTNSQMRSNQSEVSFVGVGSFSSIGTEGLSGYPVISRSHDQFPNSYHNRRRSSIIMVYPTDTGMQFFNTNQNNRMNSFLGLYGGLNSQPQQPDFGGMASMETSFDPSMLLGGAFTPTLHSLHVADQAYHSSPTVIPTFIMTSSPKIQHTTDGRRPVTSISNMSRPEDHIRVTPSIQQHRRWSSTSTLDTHSVARGVSANVPAAITHMYPASSTYPEGGPTTNSLSNATSYDVGVVARGSSPPSSNASRRDPLGDFQFDDGGQLPEAALPYMFECQTHLPEVAVPIDDIGLFDTHITFDAAQSLPQLGGGDNEDVGTHQAVIFDGGDSVSLSVGDDDDDGSSRGEGEDPSIQPPFFFDF